MPDYLFFPSPPRCSVYPPGGVAALPAPPPQPAEPGPRHTRAAKQGAGQPQVVAGLGAGQPQVVAGLGAGQPQAGSLARSNTCIVAGLATIPV